MVLAKKLINGSAGEPMRCLDPSGPVDGPAARKSRHSGVVRDPIVHWRRSRPQLRVQKDQRLRVFATSEYKRETLFLNISFESEFSTSFSGASLYSMSPQPENNNDEIPGTSTESPIDTLLRRNNSRRANNREQTYLRPRERVYMRPRRASIDGEHSRDLQEPHSSGTEAGGSSTENQAATSSELDDERERKEKLLKRLRNLGLAPNKYGNNKLRRTVSTTSGGKRKSMLSKGREKDGEFYRPLIFECKHCAKLFFHKIILKVHKRKHFPDFRCSECYKCFKNEVIYHRHVKYCQRPN